MALAVKEHTFWAVVMGRVTGVPTVAAVGVEERDVGRGTREGREGVDTAATPRFPGRLKAPNLVMSVGVVNPGGTSIMTV